MHTLSTTESKKAKGEIRLNNLLSIEGMRVLTDVFDRKLIQQTEKSGYSNYAGSAFKHLVVMSLTLPKVDPYACTTTEWNPKYGVVVKTWIQKLNCISFLDNFKYHSHVLTIKTINMLKHTVRSLKKQAAAQTSSMYPPLNSFILNSTIHVT